MTEPGFDMYSVHHACIKTSVNFAAFVLNPKIILKNAHYVVVNTVTHITGRSTHTHKLIPGS